jgi:anti-sigma regulatory factor (Ser/Thr protein kinase)
MTNEVKLFMENTMNDLSRLMKDATSFFESQRMSEPQIYQACLVLEEVLTNIVKYAFDDDTTHTISVRLNSGPAALTIEFTDDGREFNPLSLPPPEMCDSIDESKVGGQGVYLVRQTVDSMEYRRRSSTNILTTRLSVGP